MLKYLYLIKILLSCIVFSQTPEQVIQIKNIAKNTGMSKEQLKSAAKAQGYSDEQIKNAEKKYNLEKSSDQNNEQKETNLKGESKSLDNVEQFQDENFPENDPALRILNFF